VPDIIQETDMTTPISTQTTSQSNKGTALITGASTGIGAVYADRLAKRGYDLVLVARNQKRLDDLAASIAKNTGRKVDIIVADLTQKADTLRVEERLRSDKSITALVNNAGFGAAATLHDSSIEELESMIQLNVTALTRLTHSALPGLIVGSPKLTSALALLRIPIARAGRVGRPNGRLVVCRIAAFSLSLCVGFAEDAGGIIVTRACSTHIGRPIGRH